VPLPESVDQTVVLGQHGLRPHELPALRGQRRPAQETSRVLLPGDERRALRLPARHRRPQVGPLGAGDRWPRRRTSACYDQRRLRSRLRLLDYVPAALLQVLYRNALCLVMPSLYEGFGLPVREAMRHDCAVVCANRTSLPEIRRRRPRSTSTPSAPTS
jgi:hypothetical protein